MKSKTLSLNLILLCLVLLGGWGLLKIIGGATEPPANHIDKAVEGEASIASETLGKWFLPEPEKRSTVSKRSFEDEFGTVNKLISSERYEDALERVDDLYVRLNNDELDRFKGMFLIAAQQLRDSSNNNQALTLLIRLTESFDDTDSWNLLAEVAAELKDWNLAVDAMLRSSALEHRPELFESKLQALIRASNYVRAALEAQGDQIGIRDLYQRLYDQHPNHPRLQLELAQSHLRLGDIGSARPFLENLQYDLEFGTLAQQKLTALDARSTEEPDTPLQPAAPPKRSELVVPLLRSGNSFLVDVSINARPVRMLLDTGASITALSQDAIRRLNLQATDRYIRLTTANGVRRSQLYQARRVKLGRLTVDNLVVAEIDMERNAPIQGLLGTDLLNQLDNRYSYLIDNQQNALIFRRK